MQLRHLRLEIFITFSQSFRVFEAHVLIKVFLIKKERVSRLHGCKHKCAFLLDEGSLNVTTFRYFCLGFFLAWSPLFIFKYAVTATFQVLVNTYFLNFRLALLIGPSALVQLIYLVIFNNFLVFNFPFFNFEQYFPFPWIKYSLLIFDVALHYQLNDFKIPKMVFYNNRSLMISFIDAKYIHIFRTFQSFSYCKLNHS